MLGLTWMNPVELFVPLCATARLH